jgi:hypothetical protein
MLWPVLHEGKVLGKKYSKNEQEKSRG